MVCSSLWQEDILVYTRRLLRDFGVCLTVDFEPLTATHAVTFPCVKRSPE